MWNLENMAPALEGFSMALFTRVLGWSKEEVQTFLIDVRKELKDPKIHAYWPMYVPTVQDPWAKPDNIAQICGLWAEARRKSARRFLKVCGLLISGRNESNFQSL